MESILTKFEHKTNVLKENYTKHNTNPDTSFDLFVIQTAQDDPTFFRWFFDAALEQDFDASLSEQQRDTWEKYKVMIPDHVE